MTNSICFSFVTSCLSAKRGREGGKEGGKEGWWDERRRKEYQLTQGSDGGRRKGTEERREEE